jgi:hypothetical protein
MISLAQLIAQLTVVAVVDCAASAAIAATPTCAASARRDGSEPDVARAASGPDLGAAPGRGLRKDPGATAAGGRQGRIVAPPWTSARARIRAPPPPAAVRVGSLRLPGRRLRKDPSATAAGGRQGRIVRAGEARHPSGVGARRLPTRPTETRKEPDLASQIGSPNCFHSGEGEGAGDSSVTPTVTVW